MPYATRARGARRAPPRAARLLLPIMHATWHAASIGRTILLLCLWCAHQTRDRARATSCVGVGGGLQPRRGGLRSRRPNITRVVVSLHFHLQTPRGDDFCRGAENGDHARCCPFHVRHSVRCAGLEQWPRAHAADGVQRLQPRGMLRQRDQHEGRGGGAGLSRLAQVGL